MGYFLLSVIIDYPVLLINIWIQQDQIISKCCITFNTIYGNASNPNFTKLHLLSYIEMFLRDLIGRAEFNILDIQR